ncbi:MAG: hypothetical protein HY815_14760 [Candidatus Riflebacteria bacterium]|nr:hypothetical protein [Candidatus Riflebacteria bacterium]
MQSRLYHYRSSAESLIRTLQTAAREDKAAEAGASKMGCWAACAFMLGVGSCVAAAPTADVNAALGALCLVVTAASLVSGLVCVTLRSRHLSHDLEDRKYQSVVKLLKVTMPDLDPAHPIKMMIDFRGADVGGQLVKTEGGGFFSSESVRWFDHPWLTLRTRFADGNEISIGVSQSVKCKSKKKRKRTRIRMAGTETLRIALKLRPAYGAPEKTLEALRAIAVPAGLTLSAARSKDRWIKATFRTGLAVVEGRLSEVKGGSVGLLLDGHKLLGALLWLDRGIGTARASS